MLTAEDIQVQDTARRYAKDRLAPNAAKWDESGELLPQEVILELGSLGFYGLLVPEVDGGSGLGMKTYLVALEEIAAAEGGASTVMHVHGLGAVGSLARFGSTDQKAEWLARMISGEAVGAGAITEPHAGSDVASIRTSAVRDGNGWRINGTKQFISNGARAKVITVLAVTEPKAGTRGMTNFMFPTDTPGFSVGRVEKKLGQHTADTAQIGLEDVWVPDSAIFGEYNQAMPLMMSLLSDGRISIAAQALGMARAAYEHALDYAKERTAFGKAIFDHQAVAFRLADMATQIEIARTYIHSVAEMYDRGEECVKEASMAKLFASEMAERVCSDAIQIFGGNGYLRDYPVERIYRDVRGTQIYEGTNDIQRLIISRKIRG
jgi:butyryl-CoA dehydrogenase